VVGLFIGPVLLAVTYTLLKEWIARSRDSYRTFACQKGFSVWFQTPSGCAEGARHSEAPEFSAMGKGGL